VSKGVVAAASEAAAAGKGDGGTDPVGESPSTFCFYRQVSGEIFTLLVVCAPDDVCVAVGHCFVSCGHGGYGVPGLGAKPPA